MYDSRRRFLGHIVRVSAALAASRATVRLASAQQPGDRAGSLFAYVGCYTSEGRGGQGEGINVYRIDPDTGNWGHVQLVADIENPSFLARDSESRFLYSVHGDLPYATAFAIDAASGRLTPLNRQETGGTNGVHLAIDPSNRFLVVSNYATGSVAVLPINADGSLAPLSDLVELPGVPGPHPTQQTSSHPHANPFHPDGRFLFVPDKGLDRIFALRLDVADGALAWAESPWTTAAPGAGPRHVDYHPTLPITYVNNELDSTVAVYGYDSQSGALDERQLLSTLPEEFSGTNTTAEIAVHPSGRFLYVSNRGHDSIVAYAIDERSGTLSVLGWTPTGGERPRYFGLDPAGAHLYACNELGHSIVAFRVDLRTGALTPTGQIVETGSPVTIVFV
ncbi:MAG TPA: lactonase family protein [Gammaproteobacteria bacterium]